MEADQIRAFLTSVRHDRFAALFLLELTTGIRRGQVCGLKWTSVDLDAGEITVHDNRVVVGGHARYKAGGKTKNADQTMPSIRKRSPPSAPGVTTQDRERDVFGSDYHPGDYVFTFEEAGHPSGLHPAAFRPSHGSGRTIADHVPRLCRPPRYADLR